MNCRTSQAEGALLAPKPSAIETVDGEFLDLLDPDPALISANTIATGLAMACRYAGQIRTFYSVAEHSVLAHDLARWLELPSAVQFGCLMHDAPEALAGDSSAPLKWVMRRGREQSDYDVVEQRLQLATARRFEFDAALFEDENVKVVDRWTLPIEAARLTTSRGTAWQFQGNLPNEGALPEDVSFIGGLDWKAARTQFLMRLALHRPHEVSR